MHPRTHGLYFRICMSHALSCERTVVYTHIYIPLAEWIITIATGLCLDMWPHLLPTWIHSDPTRGPRAPRGPQENPSYPHAHAPQAEWKPSHHYLNRFPVSFQLSNLLLSAISLSVLSCHPAHSSLLVRAPSLQPSTPHLPSVFSPSWFSLFFINFWLSSGPAIPEA